MKLSRPGIALAAILSCLPCVAIVLFGIGLGGVSISLLTTAGGPPLLFGVIGGAAVIAAAVGLAWVLRRRSCELPEAPAGAAEPPPARIRSRTSKRPADIRRATDEQ